MMYPSLSLFLYISLLLSLTNGTPVPTSQITLQNDTFNVAIHRRKNTFYSGQTVELAKQQVDTKNVELPTNRPGDFSITGGWYLTDRKDEAIFWGNDKLGMTPGGQEFAVIEYEWNPDSSVKIENLGLTPPPSEEWQQFIAFNKNLENRKKKVNNDITKNNDMVIGLVTGTYSKNH
ncbi:hypothetical protein K435DRAFT_794389 [Dendrothele bispora CBS 962.96]|uniref:Uncharacterized protein n=1 Tax=Dendrothele bispora (strain CBS 962.96) TaxID=1314807 RepID=A0A4S8MDQ7_DENBC|nr:hypothetical protein K435DRAFT_794389 [Dendrothele bispora CBS 962.96]